MKSRTRRLVLFLTLLFVGVVALRYAAGRLYPLHYRGVVWTAATDHGVDPYLVAAVIRQESRWRPRAVSRQGARGLMQIMPETGQWAGEKMGLGPVTPEDLFDPVVNIRIGTWYLSQLLREFDGNWAAALAAYNGGRHNVHEWLEAGRWDGEARHLAEIPFPETREFVSDVLRDYQWYRRLYAGWS